jgi:indole-3-glycerol phosphate synthase
MVENILEQIIDQKKKRLKILKKNISIDSLKEKIKSNNTFLNFKNKIKNNISKNKISLIAEIKKTSPSAGIIIENYEPIDIANKYYQNNATCLSVLTEEDFFHGSLIHLNEIKKKINLPILCKDFFIDPFQIYHAKSCGADAILIILAGVSEEVANELYENALKLNMSVIVEVHNKKEAEKSLKYKEALIGINNRNLKTLETNIINTYEIHDILLKHDGPLISESGFKTKDEILEITKKTRIKTFLIGESLLKNMEKNSIFSVL